MRHPMLRATCLIAASLAVSCGGPTSARESVPEAMSPPRNRRSPPEPARPARPQRSLPEVVLELGEASVSWSEGTLTVDCRATLVNRTGRDLIAKTNFNSVFDGFTVTVRGPHGGLVARQSHVAHQSPYARDRPLPVPPGETPATLRFPIPLKAKPAGPLEVQLSGGIRGTRYSRGLRSKVVVARQR